MNDTMESSEEHEAWWAYQKSVGPAISSGFTAKHRHAFLAGLAAAEPIIREQIAQEIEAAVDEKRSTMWQTERPGLMLAARIVRGEDS